MNDIRENLSDARYELHLDAFPATWVEVSEVRIVEALTEPYKIEVVMGVAELGIDSPELAHALGRDATLKISRRGRERLFSGVVREIHEGDDEGKTAWARLVIVPALWMLSLGRDSRIFQNMSVVEILGVVLTTELARYGRAMLFIPGRPYPRREYCVQYQESNLDFVHRLMEEEGIGYSFGHDGGREVLTLHDSNRPFVYVDTGLPGGFVPYEPHNLAVSASEPIARFELRHRPTVTEVVIRDFDWTQRTPTIEAVAPRDLREILRPLGSYEHGIGRSLCIWSYEEPKYQAHDGALSAVIRKQRHAADALVGIGHGRVTGFAPGRRFQLGGHPTIGVDGEYVITRVEHRMVEEGDLAHDRYVNRFECIPYSQEYRPERRAEKPIIRSVQTATVVGPAGEEIHTDVHGRIKVHFHWDRLQPNDASSSCWVRVQQNWAGAGWGFQFIPRVGMEVVVTFIDGDPDRPLVTGCVYNGANGTPYSLPAEKTKSTIKTRSSPGGAGYNELRFEDKAGDEEIWLHGQKDWNTVIENDITERVGHDRTRIVTHDETVSIGNDQVQMVTRARTRTVGADESVRVDGNRTVSIGGEHTRRVDGGEQIGVAGERRVSVGGSDRLRVEKSHVEVAGEHRVIRAGGHTWIRASRITLEADEELLLKVGDSYLRILAEKASLESFEVHLNSAEPAPSVEPPVPTEESE